MSGARGQGRTDRATGCEGREGCAEKRKTNSRETRDVSEAGGGADPCVVTSRVATPPVRCHGDRR